MLVVYIWAKLHLFEFITLCYQPTYLPTYLPTNAVNMYAPFLMEDRTPWNYNRQFLKETVKEKWKGV